MKGTKNIYTVYVTETATLLTSNTKRSEVAFRNSGSVVVYLGTTASMTALDGFYIKQDEVYTDDDPYTPRNGGVNVWYGITSSGSSLVHIMESTE